MPCFATCVQCAMLNVMTSILPDGGAEPKPQIEAMSSTTPANSAANSAAITAPTAGVGERLRAWRNADSTRADLVRTLTVLVTLIAGGWFLARGFSPNDVAYWVLPYPAPLVAGVLQLNVASIGCGLLLLVVSVAIAARWRWAWPLLVLATLATCALAIAATYIGDVVDWAGFLVAFLLLVTAAHPAVRNRTIGETISP